MESADVFEGQEAPREITCDKCGADGLEWIHTGVRWRLFDDDGKPHKCRPDADEFGVVK